MLKLTAAPSQAVWQAAISRLVAFVLISSLLFASLCDAAALQKRVDPPRKLPSKATILDLRYQPALDFDTDSCYNVPAISCSGYLSEGLPADDLTSGCRDVADLDNSNVYSRQRCNNGWCAYMYGYYFEKDYNNIGGHRHDWEHVIVYVPDGPDPNRNEMWVCASAHGLWDCLPGGDVRWHGNYHPKIIYHKHGARTHAFRFANPSDDNIENDSKEWRLADLVSWNGFPSTALRDALTQHDFDSATFALKDSSFSDNLGSTRSNCPIHLCGNPPPRIPHSTFNPSTDENGSPGHLEPGDTCASNPDPEVPSLPIKFMIIGDSITQGFEGDYTWRYRLSQWLDSQRVNAQFVGPWTGTHTNAEPTDPKPPRLYGSGPEPQGAPRTGGAYAAGVSFSSQHWSLWGRQAAQVLPEIRSQVEIHSPDVLLIMLGFNDLGWWVSDASGLLDTMRQIVDQARNANPLIRIFLANVIQRTAIDGREDLPISIDTYNGMLRDAIPSWSRPNSRVRLVDVRSEFSCGQSGWCPATYDGLHPAPGGEFEIARSFSRVLIAAGIGREPLSIPSPDNMPPGKEPAVPEGLRVTGAPWGISINWNKVFGVPGYQLQWRQKGSSWESWPPGISWGINRWDNSWVLKGQEWEYQVRSAIGSKVSAWSGTSSAVADPTNPAGPKNIWSEPRGNSIYLAWDAVPGARSYEIATFDQDATGVVFPISGSVEGTSITLNEGLVPGHRHAILVITWVSSGPGWPAVANTVLVGGTRPGAVQDLRVDNLNPTTVQLSWSGTPGAAMYRVWFRNYKTGEAFRTDDYSTTAGTSHGVAFLFPGTWNYEFYVVPLNGNLEGGRSNTVIPPVFPGFEGRSVRSMPSQRSPLLAGTGITPIAMCGPSISLVGPQAMMDLNISPS